MPMPVLIAKLAIRPADARQADREIVREAVAAAPAVGVIVPRRRHLRRIVVARVVALLVINHAAAPRLPEDRLARANPIAAKRDTMVRNPGKLNARKRFAESGHNQDDRHNNALVADWTRSLPSLPQPNVTPPVNHLVRRVEVETLHVVPNGAPAVRDLPVAVAGAVVKKAAVLD